MRADAIVFGIAGSLFGLIVGWVLGSQQAAGSARAVMTTPVAQAAPAAPGDQSAPAQATQAAPIDQTRVITQISALRAGTFRTIDFGNLDGLVSMPSFHAAGAIIVTWAFRRHRVLLALLTVLNIGLIAATFMSGVHYFVDIPGAFVVVGASIAAFRLLNRAPEAVPSAVPAGTWPPLRWPRAARTSLD